MNTYLVAGNNVWGAGDSLEEAWTQYRLHNGSMSDVGTKRVHTPHCTIFKGKNLSVNELGTLCGARDTKPEKLYEGKVSRAPKR